MRPPWNSNYRLRELPATLPPKTCIHGEPYRGAGISQSRSQNSPFKVANDVSALFGEIGWDLLSVKSIQFGKA